MRDKVRKTQHEVGENEGTNLEGEGEIMIMIHVEQGPFKFLRLLGVIIILLDL